MIIDMQSNEIIRYLMVTLKLSHFSIAEVKEWFRIASRPADNMVRLGYRNNQYYVPSFFSFKACVRYFLSKFYFSPNDGPSKTMKNIFLFHLKSSFRSRNIQFFVFFSPSFPNLPDSKGQMEVE